MGERAKIIINEYTALEILHKPDFDLNKFYSSDYRIFITALLKENKKLKILCNKYEKEHSTEFKTWKDERQQFRDYKSRNEKAIKRCDYLLDNDLVDINGRPYVRTDDDVIVINYIKSTREGVDKRVNEETTSKEDLFKERIKQSKRIEELVLEIERLNNIINELEKWCLSWKENDKYCYLASNDKDKCRYDIWEEVLEKLQELKGGSSNDK